MKCLKKYKKMLLLFMFLVTVHTISASKSEDALQDEFSEYNENLYKKYVKMDMELKALADKGVKSLLPYVLKAKEHVNISAVCTKNLFDLVTGFRKLTNWSFNFFDAMGKFQSGIKSGNLQMFGEYEECIETTVMKKGKVVFRGQYCSMACKPYLPKVKKVGGLHDNLEGLVNAVKNSSDLMKEIASKAQGFYAFHINVGLCVPSGCTKHDTSEIVKYSLSDYVNCTVTHCFKEGDIFFWTTKRIIIVSFFVLLGIIVILSTCLDSTLETWKNNTLGFKSKLLQCFSLTRNFPKFMSTDVSDNSITCFHGIRVLTIFWVILGHEYFSYGVTLTANHISVTLDNMLSNFFSQIVLNGFASVEMFLFMSGFVNCYSRMLLKQEGRSQPGIFKIIIHRLWRIYPAYITSILLMYLLSKSQPFFLQADELTENCDLYWWRNILFISNFFGVRKMCIPQSWFLCVDMQLFLISLFTIPILLRKPKKGIILHVVIVLVTNLCSMSWWLTDDISPSTLDTTKLDLDETLKAYSIYCKAPVHVGPYVIGLISGYIIATKKDIKIPKMTQLIGWLGASLFFISMLFMPLRWHSGTPYTPLEGALYGAWSRTILVLGFSWLVLCCATGHGGLINYLLSLNLWIPLSRTTYMLYLVSPLIQGHYTTHMRFPEEFSTRRVIWNYFGNLSISILMSIALVLLVESPTITMEKVLFQRNKDENKTPPEKTNELTCNNTKENGFKESGKFATIHL